MTKFIDLTGKRFGKLLVLGISDQRTADNRICFRCICDCSSVVVVRSRTLINGGTTSCGCKKIKMLTKHGFLGHPLYNCWRHIKARCQNRSHPNYHQYGGRGIILCSEWENPKTFVEWGLKNGWKKGLQIDRIDNNKGYYPENCRFVTTRINTSNTRRQENRKLPTGVYQMPGGKFRARAKVGVKNTHIGTFENPEDAHQAYLDFVSEME